MAPLLSDTDRWKAWDSFLEATPDTGFMQSSWWAMFRSAVGYEYFAVTVKDEDTIVGGALVAKWSYSPRSCFYYIQDGPVLPRDDSSTTELNTAIRQGISTKPPSYFRNLVSGLSAVQKVSIFFAEYQGRRLATALVVYFGRRATYFFGGSLSLHRRVMAPYLLHFEIMRRAKALGCEWYDFWGIAPKDQPDHSWQDISAFKRKFGGVEVNLVPALDYVYDAAAYERYVAAESERGSPAAG